MTNDEMLERLGKEATLEMVDTWYTGTPQETILVRLNNMFPDDDNAALAEKIFDFCDKSEYKPGRPPLFGETMKQIGYRLTKEQREFINKNGGNDYLRKLIDGEIGKAE